jgi:hypothetical protein
MIRFAMLLSGVAALAACSGVTAPGQKTLSFSAMQMLNEGVEGEWILNEYPDARQVERRPDGTLERLTYTVNDPQGRSRGLVMDFDATGVLARKRYGGPVVRPPSKSDNAGFGS